MNTGKRKADTGKGGKPAAAEHRTSDIEHPTSKGERGAPMKDLFVELTRLHNGHGIAASLAVTMRDEMLRDSPRQGQTQALLAHALRVVGEEAQQLAEDVRADRVGVAFVDGDRPAPKQAGRKKL